MSTVKPDWRKSSAIFDTKAQEYDNWFQDSLLFDIELKAIKALKIPQSSPALEIGVGPGRFALALGSTHGVDPANAPLHLASKRGIICCQAVGEALPFADKTFSRVSILFTICFVQNLAAVLREALRVLKKDGNLLLGFVPSSGSWGKFLDAKKKDGHPFYEHARFFSCTECRTLLKHCGLKIIKTQSTLFQKPDSVTTVEQPRPLMDDQAGFIAFHAQADTI